MNTITSTIVKPNTVATPNVTTATITIGDEAVNKIMTETDDTSSSSIVTANMMERLRMSLQNNINAINPDNKFYVDSAVISQPLLPLNATSPEWIYDNWNITNEMLIYSQISDDVYNKIYIPNKYFNAPGYYFVEIDVFRLDGGKVVLYSNDGKVLLEATEAGAHLIEVPVQEEFLSTTSFYIQAISMNPGETVIISSIGFYKVADRFKSYVTYWLTDYIEGSSEGFVTNEMLDKALEDLKAEIEGGGGTGVEQDLQLHILANNPHNITATMIGAANRFHEHTINQITDLTPLNIDAADRVHAHVVSDITDLTPEAIGAAPVNHSHPEYDSDGSVSTAGLFLQDVTNLTINDLEPGYEWSICDPKMEIPFLSKVPGDPDTFGEFDQLSLYLFTASGRTAISLNRDTNITKMDNFTFGDGNYVYLIRFMSIVDGSPVYTYKKWFSHLAPLVGYKDISIDGSQTGVPMGGYSSMTDIQLPYLSIGENSFYTDAIVNPTTSEVVPDVDGIIYLGMRSDITDINGNPIYTTTPCKQRTVVPINNFTTNTGTFLIENIYHTPYIRLDVYNTDSYVEGVSIDVITPFVIQVTITVPGTYFLDITRTF